MVLEKTTSGNLNRHSGKRTKCSEKGLQITHTHVYNTIYENNGNELTTHVSYLTAPYFHYLQYF